MGMKEEIFSIATALGYEGATPTSKTKAVHAVAQAVEEGGGGGGGAAGYDVTKVWAVPEQTVTSKEYVYDEGTEDEYRFWGAEVNVGDLAQMYADGQTDLTLAMDGREGAATLTMLSSPSGIEYGIQGQGEFDVMPLDESTYAIGPLSDTEPTAHTVSCYYEAVTTTPEFDAAVEKSVENTEDTVTLTLTHGEEDTVTCDKPSSKFIIDDPRRLDWRLVSDDGSLYVGSLVILNDGSDVSQGFTVDFISQAVIQETDNDELDILSYKVAASFGSSIGDDGFPEVIWSIDSGTSNRISLSGDGDHYEVTTTSQYGDSPWTLNKSVSDIYNAYDAGKRVVFRASVYSGLPVYLEGVTEVSRPSFSVTEFKFEKVFVNTVTNQLVRNEYHVYTDNGTPTMTLTETAYQLTLAS